MFKELTYLRKNQLLIAAFVVLLFLVYSLAIKKTMNESKQVSDAEKKIELAANAPLMAAQLQKELMLMDEKIGDKNLQGQNTAQTLLELVTNYCKNNHAVLREFPETNTSNQEGLIIETNRFVVEGSFSALINLVYVLEQKNKLGKISSAAYQIKKDFKIKNKMLIVTIYLQNIKN